MQAGSPDISDFDTQVPSDTPGPPVSLNHEEAAVAAFTPAVGPSPDRSEGPDDADARPGGPRPRATLTTRIAHGVEQARALLKLMSVRERDVPAPGRIASPSAQLDAAARRLDHMIAILVDWLRDPHERGRSIPVLRAREVLGELHGLRHEVADAMLALQGARLRGIADALQRLRGLDSMAQMVRRAPGELCVGCGFDRCLLFGVDGAELRLESAYFAAEPEWRARFTEYAKAHPPQVDSRDREIELLRRRVPILVEDPASTHGMHDVIAGAWRSPGYVAAPVILRGNVVGSLHADRYFTGERVDVFARDVLAAFAVGFGYALERVVLLDRSRSELRRVHAAMAATEHSIKDLINTGVSLSGTEPGQVSAGSSQPSLGACTDSRLAALLTPRELEVMELMARGASNSDIATELVISEGTVKSHVKHILRKLRAANRAQAVSTYMRLQGS